MDREEIIKDFINCIRDLFYLGFDMHKNSAIDLIAATIDYMRETGRIDEELTNLEIFNIIFPN